MNSWDFIRNPTGLSLTKCYRGKTITIDTAREVKALLRSGMARKDVVEKLKDKGVKSHHVSDIATDRTWRDL